MGKDKKPSKGKLEKDFGQEAVDSKPQNEEASGKKKNQRTSKKKREEWDKEVGEQVESLSIENDEKESKKTKPKGANSRPNKMVDDGSEDEERTVPLSKARGKASAFQMLMMEEGSASDKSQSEEEVEKQVVEVEKKGKKSKKKERRRNDDDEEVDKMLEELALEIGGKKPVAKAIETMPGDDAVAKTVETVETESTEKKKKKKKQLSVEVEVKASELEDEGGEDEGHTVKSAAQKKKEKKEREKEKRLAQGVLEKTKKTKEPSKEPEVVEKETTPDDTKDETKDQNDDEFEEDEKKKKKKKKGEDDDKKDKKRPGRKQIAAMQEALKKLKEDEEKRKEEEEQKQKAAEEAELLRLEKLRLEQERKDRKKQKEKEKRERLKAEGKLLTKAQKQARARMEATLQALRQQGMEVPQIGEKREKAPRPGDRRKPMKKKVEEQSHELKNGVETESPQVPQVELEIVGFQATQQEDTKDDEPETPEDVSKDVKDAWDESSEDEKETDVIKQKAVPKVDVIKQKPMTKVPEKIAPPDDVDESEDGSEEESEASSDVETEESSDESSSENEDMSKYDKIRERIRKRKEEAEKKRSLDKLRSPIVCVLGHVDTGKTKILDKIRNTHVQDGEAGGITQQIGATMIPKDAIKEQCKMVKNFLNMELKLPGLLIIDTPGHESFSNLRSRGSSLCDIAILVVDIMHGLEPQTLESINLLKQRKTPFIVALNKIDRLYEWRSNKHKDVQDVITSQQRNTKQEFDERTKEVILQFNEQGLNAALFYENDDPRTYVSLVPTSAGTGDGMGNLISLVVDLTQNIMPKKLAYSEDLQATVLEVKAIPGLGTTIDVILVNGSLREGDSMILAGHDGPVVTQIRSLLMPQPMKELRVKTPYREFKEIEASQGVKITGKDLDKAIAGLQLLIAHQPDEVDVLKEEVNSMLKEVMNAIKLSERGVYVQASTLGSLEALLEFLRTSKIPYSGIRIGPVVKKDVMKASIMLEHDSQYAVILAFDVKIERDAQDLADNLGVKIFQADIIYHLFDKFMAYREELKLKKRDEFKHVAVFPCKLRILPQFIFNSRDPIVVGVSVEAGVIKEGTPLCVPSREFLEIGTVTTIEINHKTIDSARKGQEVCIKIEPLSGEAPKMFGRHFDHTDALVSKITRQSIDACKDYFRDDLQKTDWQLMVELKKLFQIM